MRATFKSEAQLHNLNKIIRITHSWSVCKEFCTTESQVVEVHAWRLRRDKAMWRGIISSRFSDPRAWLRLIRWPIKLPLNCVYKSTNYKQEVLFVRAHAHHTHTHSYSQFVTEIVFKPFNAWWFLYPQPSFNISELYILLTMSMVLLHTDPNKYKHISWYQWHSTFFVCVPPDIFSLQLCTPRFVGVDFPCPSRPAQGLICPPVKRVPSSFPAGKAAGAWR